MQSSPYRLRLLARIHVGKKQLALTDDDYRAILERVAGIRSAADATPQQLALILVEFHRLGWESGKEMPRPHTAKRRPRPGQATERQIAKVWALLGERPPEYAEGILRRMYGDRAPTKLEWADGEQLGKLIAALTYDAKRKTKQTTEETTP